MGDISFKSIMNSTISKIIAGIILLLIPKIREYCFDGIVFIWSGMSWCWDVLLLKYSFPGWGFVVLFFLSVVGLFNIALSLKGKKNVIDWGWYTEDFIYGVKCRWKWNGNEIVDVQCYCPQCDATLVYDDRSCRSFMLNISKTDFICENCGNTVISTVEGGDMKYAIGAIKREISRRVRTGEYKKDSA